MKNICRINHVSYMRRASGGLRKYGKLILENTGLAFLEEVGTDRVKDGYWLGTYIVDHK